jgi:hypothetical protein
LITNEDDMSFEDRLRAQHTANLRHDIEDTLCIAMSEIGFEKLREDMERRRGEAACLVEIAQETLRSEQANLDEVEPVMDLVYAIGAMRSVAAEFGKTPVDVAQLAGYILQSASRPLNADNCANRLRDMLLDRETPEEREARDERDFVEATCGGSHFNDPVARAERAICA